MKTILTALITGALLIIATGPAAAEDSVDCAFWEIRASSGPAEKIAPELKPLEKKLKRPPFSSWNTFELLSSTRRTLPVLKAQSFKLTEGQASVLYRESGESKKKRRLSLSVTMEDKDGKRVVDMKVNVDVGDYVAVGRSIDNGKNGHVLALSCH
ncbi:MAG: hypothetical protein R3B48_09030 [Kofleriaceae bacterium]